MINVNLEAAIALGLTVWQPRMVRCLVLQHGAHGIRYTLTSAEQKILTGMLSVLDLPVSDIKQTVLYGANAAILATQMQAVVTRWQAQYVLLLDTVLPMPDMRNVVQTFSPSYLLRHPQSKPQAYKSLLTLRAMLHGTS